MCGIIAYKGSRCVEKTILEGLKKLEYRGYDSWGIAVKDKVGIKIKKRIGKVGEVKSCELFGDDSDGGTVGIAHTRWATTGGVLEKNSHPHVSYGGKFILVHNGIVQNYSDIKKRLISKGYQFASDTDSEAVVNLMEYYLDEGNDYLESSRKAFLDLEGRNAVVAMYEDSDDVIAFKCGAPLVVGLGDKEYFIASDVLPFIKYTGAVNYLNDNEMVVINSHPKYFDLFSGESIEKKIYQIDRQEDHSVKGVYAHFMLKEIKEQVFSLKKSLDKEETCLNPLIRQINKADKIAIIGAGTAGVVSLLGQYLFSQIANKKIEYISPSEYKYFASFYGLNDLMIVISQSGETADCLQAMEIAKNKGVNIISLVNVEGSSIFRASDEVMLLGVGPEMAVASTKATSSQMVLLSLLAYTSAGKFKLGKKILNDLADSMGRLLNNQDFDILMSQIVAKISCFQSMFIIGRGMNYPIALEAAIKLQEVGYIHAQGFAGAELKHGPLALITKGIPVLVLFGNDGDKKNILANAAEIKSRGAYMIGIGPEKNSVFDDFINVPDVGGLSALINLIPVQILAYNLSVLRGIDPDKPRNLAKSVTVL